MIDWLDRVLPRIVNISTMLRRRLLVKYDHFWNCEVSLEVHTSLYFIQIQWNGLLTAKWGCYPWHGAPFNVPSDGHALFYHVLQFTMQFLLLSVVFCLILCNLLNCLSQLKLPAHIQIRLLSAGLRSASNTCLCGTIVQLKASYLQYYDMKHWKMLKQMAMLSIEEQYIPQTGLLWEYCITMWCMLRTFFRSTRHSAVFL